MRQLFYVQSMNLTCDRSVLIADTNCERRSNFRQTKGQYGVQIQVDLPASSSSSWSSSTWGRVWTSSLSSASTCLGFCCFRRDGILAAQAPPRSQLFHLGHGSCRRFAQLLDLKVMTPTSAPASESTATALEMLPVNGFVVGQREDFVLLLSVTIHSRRPNLND